MRNRVVGIMVLGIAALIAFIVLSFNMAFTSIINASCSHGPTCPMWATIDFQTNVGIGIDLFIVAIGLYLIFFGREERIVTRIKPVIKTIKQQLGPEKITKENYQKAMEGLDQDEKSVLEKVIESNGSIFQSELAEKTSMNKVRVTRILDRLEGRHLIERKRRGMTNIVILRQ